MKFYSLLLTALSLMFCGLCGATKLPRELNTISFNEVFGLSEQTIYDAFECESGLYFGSSSGLYYFDGDSIKSFKLQGFPSEYTNLQQDPKGRIWFSNFNGQIFYFDNDSIHLFLDQSFKTDVIIEYNLNYYPTIVLTDEKSISTVEVRDSEKTETLLLTGKVVYEAHNKEVQYCIIERGNEFTVVSLDSSMNLDTLSQFRLKKTVKIQFLTLGSQLVICNIGSNHTNLLSYDLEKNELREVLDVKAGIFSFNQYTKVNDSTIAYLDKKGYQLISTNTWGLKNQELQLTDNSASNYLPTKSGFALLTTLNNGVQLIPNSGFEHIKLDKVEIGKYEFVGHDIYFLDLEGQLWKMSLEKNILSKLNFRTDYNSKLHYEEVENRLLLSNGKESYDIKNNLKSSLKLFPFKQLVRAFGTLHGTYSHLLYTKDNEGLISYRNKRCNRINFDSINQTLYVDFIDGLHKADSTMKFVPVVSNNNRIFPKCIEPKNKGGVWVLGSGGNLWSIEKEQIKLIKSFEQSFNQIEEDKKGDLYLSNETSIIHLDIKNFKTTEITQSEGLLKKAILGIKLLQDQLIVVNPDGVQFLKLNDSTSNPIKPVLKLKSFFVNDEERSIEELQSLHYKENRIGIYFTSLHLKSLGNETIEYRFKHRDSSWSKLPGKIGYLEFPQLSPGDYQLQIRVCGVDGNCNSPQIIELSIQKAWFNTGWFYIGILLGLIVLVFFVSKTIIKHKLYLEKLLRDKETAEKERQLSKIKAIQAQMNPHFVFNALNSIQDYILSNQKELASEYLADFADLIRSYLKQTQQDEIEVSEEIETLQEYLKLEKLRLGEDFKYQIEFKNEEEIIKSIQIPVMLIQPFVENSIKHGLLPKEGDRKLLISFELQADRLIIIICDNGIGVSASLNQNKKEVGLSFGNKAIKDKIELLNIHQKLEVRVQHLDGFNDQEIKGTRVILSLKAEGLFFLH